MKRKPIIEVKFNNPFKKEKLKPDFIYKGYRFFILDPDASENSLRRFSYSRAMQYANALNDIALNIDSEDLEIYVNEIQKAIEAKDINRITLLNLTLGARIKLKAHEKSYMRLGMACVKIDNEIDEDEEMTALKMSLAKENDLLSAFFLRVAVKCLSHGEKSLNTLHLWDYFRSRENQEIDKILHELIYGNTDQTTQSL